MEVMARGRVIRHVGVGRLLRRMLGGVLVLAWKMGGRERGGEGGATCC